MKMAERPTLQQMLKTAMEGAGSVSRSSIAQEAQRQLENLDVTTPGQNVKTAEEQDVQVSGEYARQLASAMDYVADLIKTGADLAGPYNLSENKVSPGAGPGALKVMESRDGPPISENSGQAKTNQPPMHPGLERALPSGKDGATQIQTDANHRPGADAEAGWAPMGDHSKLSMAQLIKKTAGAKTSSVASMIRKTAEDAINPARISAGAAQAPHTLEAGDAGPGGENKGLVPTDPKAVADFTRRQAKAPSKAEMHKYLDEPALSASSDKVLENAFAATNEAGAKISSAQELSKTAAARVLFQKLAAGAGADPSTVG